MLTSKNLAKILWDVYTSCYILNHFFLRPRTCQSSYEAKCDHGVFLGYSNNSHAYRVYNLITFIVIESINVGINDTSVTKIIEYKDHDIFGD